MAFQLFDRVQETTATSGTGPVSLGGAVAGFIPFGSVMNDGDTTFYGILDGINWEVGLGTYAVSGNTLARTTILSSSNGGAVVTLSSNAKAIWMDVPAVYLKKNTGSTTLYFGTTGQTDANTVITGQTGILSTSIVNAWISPAATVDHTIDEHWVEQLSVVAGNIVPGTGFTIYGSAVTGNAVGTFNVLWSWF